MRSTIFEAMGGHEACLALAGAWHERVMSDPVVSHAFHAGVHEHHVDRLAAYFADQLGGPTAYTDDIADYSSVVRTHTGNGPHEQMDGRAVAAFVRALDDASIPDDPELRSALIA